VELVSVVYQLLEADCQYEHLRRVIILNQTCKVVVKSEGHGTGVLLLIEELS